MHGTLEKITFIYYTNLLFSMNLDEILDTLYFKSRIVTYNLLLNSVN